ncbi:MAG: FecR family protein [Pseudomonadota bacterium]
MLEIRPAKRFICLAIISAATLLLPFGIAYATEWNVVRVSKGVERLSSENRWAPLTRGITLSSGATIRTGARGRAVLKREKESLAISPGTTITLPSRENRNGRTVVHQLSGSVKYKVRKRNARNFSVDTPFLTAAVKGTRFTVSVGTQTSEISVSQGTVEVGDYDTGQFAQLNKGQSALTSNRRSAGLRLSGRNLGDIRQRPPRSSPAARSARDLERQLRSETGSEGRAAPSGRAESTDAPASEQREASLTPKRWNPTAGFRGFGFGQAAQIANSGVQTNVNTLNTLAAAQQDLGRNNNAERSRRAAVGRAFVASAAPKAGAGGFTGGGFSGSGPDGSGGFGGFGSFLEFLLALREFGESQGFGDFDGDDDD